VTPFFDASILVTVTVAFVSTDRIDKLIDANIEEAEKKKPVGFRKRKNLNWPKRELRRAAFFWAMATVFFGIDLIIDAVPQAQLPDFGFQYFFGGVIAMILGAVASGNLVAFTLDRKFKPTLTPPKVLGATLAALMVLELLLSVTIAIVTLRAFFLLPLLLRAFDVSMIPSILGVGLVIHRILSTWKKGPSLSRLGMLLFASPIIVLLVFGFLIRLGVPT